MVDRTMGSLIKLFYLISFWINGKKSYNQSCMVGTFMSGNALVVSGLGRATGGPSYS